MGRNPGVLKNTIFPVNHTQFTFHNTQVNFIFIGKIDYFIQSQGTDLAKANKIGTEPGVFFFNFIKKIFYPGNTQGFYCFQRNRWFRQVVFTAAGQVNKTQSLDLVRG